MSAYKIAIVGSGLAGLAAASFLKQSGHDVTVFERFPELRASGAGLLIQPSGLAVLSHLDLDEEIIAKGARIDTLHGETTAGKTIVDLHYKDAAPNLFGVGIHRATLFNVLMSKARQLCVQFVTDCDIQSSGLENGQRTLKDSSGKIRGAFDLVIDASGYKSPLRVYGEQKSSKAYPYGALWGVCKETPGNHSMEQRYKGTHTMIGIMPIGKKPGSDDDHAAFFWSMPADKLHAWKDAGLDAWKKEVSAHWPAAQPYLDQFTSPDQLTFAPYADVVMKSWHAERLVFIGDAAHSTSPQLGQGANMGFIDAFTLTKKIQSAPDLQTALEGYSAERKGHVRFHQRASRLLTPFFQSAARPVKGPLRDTSLSFMLKIPYARKQMTLMFAGVKKGVFKKLNPGKWNKKYGI